MGILDGMCIVFWKGMEVFGSTATQPKLTESTMSIEIYALTTLEDSVCASAWVRVAARAKEANKTVPKTSLVAPANLGREFLATEGFASPL